MKNAVSNIRLAWLGLAAMTLAAPVCRLASAGTWHVDDSAPAGGDGLTWPTAMNSLQTALAAALAGDEVHVAHGVYHPAGFFGDRTISFMLRTGVAIRGGYAGFDARDPELRDVNLFSTTLSGDLNSNDDGTQFNLVDNSFHVVRAEAGVDRTAILDGVIVQDGVAFNSGGNNTTPNAVGGGILLVGAQSPSIIDCRLLDNRAWHGSAIAAIPDPEPPPFGPPDAPADPLLLRCDLRGNHTFVGVTPPASAVYFKNAAGVIRACRIDLNFCGGAWLVSSSTTISNCDISFNEGVGIRNDDGPAVITNCTIFRNLARGLDDVPLKAGPATITNSILWFNFFCDVCSPLTNISYCDVGDAGITGTGVLHLDPKFVNRYGPDGLPGTGDEDLRLLPISPCIDAASNTAADPLSLLDLLGLPRFVDDPDTIDTGEGAAPLADMGAYELQVELPVLCPADVSPVDGGDGFVGIDDLLAVINGWGPCPKPPAECPANVLGAGDDGAVNIDDLLAVISAWGPCP